MLENLKNRIVTSPKYTRWFWWGVLGLVVVLIGAALLLRRRAVLGRLAQLRIQLAQKNQLLLDAKTAAETARHSDAIDQHTARVEEIKTEIAGIQEQIADAEKEHQAVLAEINQASDWSELEALRQKGNRR